MKKIVLFNLISLLYFNFSAHSIKTDLLIRAQDDETEGGLKLKISIPKAIENGPKGDDIEVVTEKSSEVAVKDNDDNFILYSIDANTNRLIREIDSESLPLRSPGKSETVFVHGVRKNVKHLGVDETSFFDSVSTFGTVLFVLNMYENDILGLKEKRGSIRVYPHMTPSLFSELYPGVNYDDFRSNAFYDNSRGHVLCFFPLASDALKYTSQSFDVVAHETGHYVLNVLRPELLQSASSDVRAFHESFGDVTALFSILSIDPLRQQVLKETGENLHKASFLSVIGEKIVDRDAARCTDLSVLPSCEEHDLSERLTRALYGTLADFFDIARRQHGSSKGLDLVLKGTVDTFRKSFLRATLSSKLTSFVDFGRSLMEQKELPQYFVLTNFSRQQIDLTNPLSLQQVCLKKDKDQSALLRCSTGRLPKFSSRSKELESHLRSLRLSEFSRSPGSASSSAWR